MTKVNSQNYSQLDFLINNFYEIVEYKRGRGIYGDRVVWKRPKRAEAIFNNSDKLYEFYYMDANAVKELPRTVLEKINVVKRLIVSPEAMNILCGFKEDANLRPHEWAMETEDAFIKAQTLDYEVLNNILVERYRLLDSEFLSKLKKHREMQYYLASSDEYNFVTKEYATKQIASL